MPPILRPYLHQNLLNHFQNPQKILILEGVRQTGKTTAIEMALARQKKKSVFITLTNNDIGTNQIREAKTLPELTRQLKRYFQFEPDGSQILVIDEAQRSYHLYSMLMQIHKDWKNVAVVLSGSVMGAFFHRHANSQHTSPAGRIEKIICRPFSFFEYLELIQEVALLDEIKNFNSSSQFSEVLHEELLQHYFNYMSTGGHPEAIQYRQDTEALYKYLATLFLFFQQDVDHYINEVTGENNKQYSQLFRATVDAIARLTASPTKRSSLISTDSPAYRKELPALLNALEEWHFLFRLPTQMKTMSTKRGTQSKKYLWDVGIFNHLTNLSRPLEKQQKDLIAKALETSVAQELVFYLQTKDRLMSWKSHQKQNKEMDFLARFTHQDIGIEVKSSLKISKKSLSQVFEYLKAYPQNKACVVYLGPYKKDKLLDFEITLIPPYLIGLLPNLLQ